MDYLIKRTAKTERYDNRDEFIDRILDITAIAEESGAESMSMSVFEDIGCGDRTVNLDHIVGLLKVQADKYYKMAVDQHDEFVRSRYEMDRCKHLFLAQKFLGMYRGLLVVMNTYSQPMYDRYVAKSKEMEQIIGATIQKYYKYKIKE